MRNALYLQDDMDIPCTEKESMLFKKIAHAASSLQMPCYIIGGFVRDKLIGRKTKDADIVCVGDGIKLAQQVAALFNPAPPVAYFKTFGTAQIRLDDLEVEFVGARKESYRYHSRNPTVEPGTLEEDLLRRDFTINTLGISLNEEDYGKLNDPFNGLEHLRDGIIQTPLDPDKTFSDDPLRMMRGIRFAAQLGFSLPEHIIHSIKNNVERIRIISQERITDEINKILLCERPSLGFDLLYQTGLLHIIFPQMVDLAGAEYIDGKGHKDNFYHTLQVVDNIVPTTDNLWLRWAALLHDIGKPATKKFEQGHGWTFHGHEVVGARMVPRIFGKFKLPQHETMRYVQKMVELHLRPISLTKENITDSAIRRLLFDAGDDITDLMKLCKADITSKNKLKAHRFLSNFEYVEQRLLEVEEKDRLRNWQPPVTGELIMETFGIGPCRAVGDIKTAIRDAILDGVIGNDFDSAFDYLLQKGRELNLQRVK